MTTRENPTDTYTKAATIARELASEENPTSPAHRFGNTLGDLFDQLSDESLRLGGLPPRVRQLGVDLATTFVAAHRDDLANDEVRIAAAAAGDPFARALQVMRTNEQVSPAASVPRELAAAVCALIEHVVDPETELDALLLALLRRMCAAIVAVDEADPDELLDEDLRDLRDLGPGEFPIGVMPDGSLAVGTHVPGSAPVHVAGKSNVAGRMLDELDGFRAGAMFALGQGVAVSAASDRFRLMSAPDQLHRVEVYDETRERCAVITERRGGTEWRVAAINAHGYAETLDTISFARAVERLDVFLAAGQGAE